MKTKQIGELQYADATSDNSQAKMSSVPTKKQARMGLMDLPVETLLEILKRLPVKSVYCMRCASKTLLEIVDSPLFVSLHTVSSIATNAVAEELQVMLLVDDAYNETAAALIMAVQSLQYNENKNEAILSEIMYAADKSRYTIPFVFNNLFCFMNKRDGFRFLIDPFRGEVLRLSTGTKFENSIAEYYGMGFDNITGTYKIVCVSQVSLLSGIYLVAEVHVLGTSSWHEVRAPVGPFWRTKFLNSKSVCAYGDVHWLFHEKATEESEGANSILSFDFTNEEFYSTPTPASLPNSEEKLKYLKFITLRGTLAIVDSSSGTKIAIWVMKDYNKKEWMREHTIFLQMLRSNLRRKFMFSTHCGEWENGIFFLWDEVGTSFFFDLRNFPVTIVRCPIKQDNEWRHIGRILSLKKSLISLKSFGDLIQESEPGSQNLLDFSRNYLWRHSRKPEDVTWKPNMCSFCL